MKRATLIAMLPSLLIAAIAAAFVYMTYAYDPAARALPLLAGMIALALALVDAAARGSGTVTLSIRNVESAAAAAHATARLMSAFAWIGVFLPLVAVLGFYGAIPLYVFSYLRLFAGKGALGSAAAAFGLTGSLYLVFEIFMGYEIFGGLLGGDFL